MWTLVLRLRRLERLRNVFEYIPSQDRFDVAIRTIVKLAQGKLRVRGVNTWDFLTELGIRRKEHEEKITDAMDRVDSLSTDAGLSVFLHHCPFVLPASLELLRRYNLATAASRREYYKQNRKSGVKSA